MSDTFDASARSAVMRAVRGRDTGPERRVRTLLTAAGYRYRLHRTDLPGAPDIVFPGRRAVVFVHGCFWHGHDCARGARLPKTNTPYWRAKIARNRARDGESLQRLATLGWRALVVWECALKPEETLKRSLEAFLAGPAELK